ncbi:hypothetical protein OG883_44015 [Streptomyces sp. NBC_01142]|uniref:hypothetical protein n=1 Tax=Streptomyces sp. NBC_01142 TaxID=2975865 RepID=UPI002251C9A2|nr:hypothetical protein [Streptomyces sp. NBC_01142]MCX4826609.1 hypothetical protein [Streptomyces sp. NBC_01142]
MTDQQQPTPRDSRLADQPAMRPVGPLPKVGPRPTFDDLMTQTDERDYQPLAAHLDDAARTALELPAAPQAVTVDRELAGRIRDYYFDRPDQIAQLPDAIRDLINL